MDDSNTIARSRAWNILGVVFLGAAAALVVAKSFVTSADPSRGVLIWACLIVPLWVLHEHAHVIGYRRAGVPRSQIVRRATWVAVECRISRSTLLRGISAPLYQVAVLVVLATVLSLVPADSLWLDAAETAASLLAVVGLMAAWGDVYWLLRVARHPAATEYRDEGRRLVFYLPAEEET
jgi:hypothetical protein